MGEVGTVYFPIIPQQCALQSIQVYSFLFIAPTHRWHDPQTFSCQDWQISPGKIPSPFTAHPYASIIQKCYECHPFNILKNYSLLASDRTAGAWPVSFGVHDEVFPWDQRKRGDEENHWSLRADGKTAGRTGILLQMMQNGGESAKGFFFFFFFLCLQLFLNWHLACLPGQPNQELVRWSEVPGVFCLAGLAEPSHAVSWRAHQSLGYRDHWRIGRSRQRVWRRHDAS